MLNKVVMANLCAASIHYVPKPANHRISVFNKNPKINPNLDTEFQ